MVPQNGSRVTTMRSISRDEYSAPDARLRSGGMKIKRPALRSRAGVFVEWSPRTDHESRQCAALVGTSTPPPTPACGAEDQNFIPNESPNLKPAQGPSSLTFTLSLVVLVVHLSIGISASLSISSISSFTSC